MTDEKLLYKEECYAIQGAIFEVYRQIGCGFLEAVYQECLIREFDLRQIPYVVKPTVQIEYKGVSLEQIYQPDIICYGLVLIELKAVRKFANEHRAQVLNYLKATKLRLGLLVNFGTHPKATIERIAL
jgi:GxxExxY protein